MYVSVLLVASIDLAFVVLPILADVLWHESLALAWLSTLFASMSASGLLTLWYGLRAVMRALLMSDSPRGFWLVRPLVVQIWLFRCAYAAVGLGIFTGYATVYRRLSFAMRRSQEFEADASAERVVGGEELARALLRIHVLGAAWSDFQSRFLVPMQRAGCTPDDSFEEFGRMLADDDCAQSTDRPTPAGVLRSVAVRRGDLTAALASRAGSQDSANAPSADPLCLLAGWLFASDSATEQVAARVTSFAVDPTEANESWLLDHLRSLGIDPGEPVDLTIGHQAPPAGAGTATAPGDTVVIRPMSEPEALQNERTLTRIVSGALVLTAMAVGMSVRAHAPLPNQPPPVNWSQYPALPEPTLTMPSLSGVLPDFPNPAPWPEPAHGGTAGCPPPPAKCG